MEQSPNNPNDIFIRQYSDILPVNVLPGPATPTVRLVDSLIPLQLFLFELQLKHDGVELHVEVVGFLQLPLVVLTNVQRMPEEQTQTEGGQSLLWTPRFPPERVLHAS